MSLVIDAGVELTLKAGGGLVKLDPSGITITGPLVRINSGGAATPGKPAQVQSPQAPTAAEKGDKPGQASSAAMPNTAPVINGPGNVQWIKGGNLNPEPPPQRVAVAGRDTTLTVDDLDAAPSWVSIKLESESGEAMANAEYLIVDEDGKEYSGVTDAQGVERIQGLPPGNCQVSFPNSDPWKK
jgi:type VI secretion system secreted protein VgrG